VILPRALFAEITEHAETELPHECAGLLAGQHGIASAYYPLENVHSTPAVNFRMPFFGKLRTLWAIQRAGLELLAIVHSHPQGTRMLSIPDLAHARRSKADWLLVCPMPDFDEPHTWVATLFNSEGGLAMLAVE
jgi:proteasome lid subunit RPN8/RPN11